MNERQEPYSAGGDDPVYAALAAHFPAEEHKTLERAGGQTYVPWNLVAERLNTVLGVENWSFRILREGFTATECWVLGEMTVTIREIEAVRQQYGVSPLTMGAKETPVDDLMKKAGTDALKKCAQVFGVALYLTDADERREVQAAMRGQKAPPKPKMPAHPANEPSPMDRIRAAAMVTGAAPPAGPTCQVCEAELHQVRFKDGTVWEPADLAKYGLQKYDRVLCMNDYRKANQAARDAEEALQKIT
jgi:hypothetical protein